MIQITKLPVLLAVIVSIGAVAQSMDMTFEAALRGKKCSTSSIDGSIQCEYKVGKDLHFAIAGVGESDASIVFYHSDMGGDFYASFGIKHQCVTVKTGAKAPKGSSPLGFAFVSPKNGKVYRTWEECQASR